MTPEERYTVIEALKREAKQTAIWAAVCVVLAVVTVNVGTFVLLRLFGKE
mgnify:CR=1 FL=1